MPMLPLRYMSWILSQLHSASAHARCSCMSAQCNECGHSRFGKLEYTATAVRSAEYAAVSSEEDVQLALDALDAAVVESHEQQAVLTTLRRSGC